LHDVLEKHAVKKEILEKEFGQEVCGIVEEVTKISKIHYSEKTKSHAENFRKMIMAMASDIRVLLIKLADRLNHLKTLNSMTSDIQLSIAREKILLLAFQIIKPINLSSY